MDYLINFSEYKNQKLNEITGAEIPLILILGAKMGLVTYLLIKLNMIRKTWFLDFISGKNDLNMKQINSLDKSDKKTLLSLLNKLNKDKDFFNKLKNLEKDFRAFRTPGEVSDEIWNKEYSEYLQKVQKELDPSIKKILTPEEYTKLNDIISKIGKK